MATETASTGRDSDKFMLRFPEGMRSLIKDAAEKNGRTMNAEIVARLQQSFEAPTAVGSQGLPPDLTQPWSEEAMRRFESFARKAGEAAAQHVLIVHSNQTHYGGDVGVGLASEPKAEPGPAAAGAKRRSRSPRSADPK